MRKSVLLLLISCNEKPSNTALKASGLILYRCCTNADVEGISEFISNAVISSFVRLLDSLNYKGRFFIFTHFQHTNFIHYSM